MDKVGVREEMVMMEPKLWNSVITKVVNDISWIEVII